MEADITNGEGGKEEALAGSRSKKTRPEGRASTQGIVPNAIIDRLARYNSLICLVNLREIHSGWLLAQRQFQSHIHMQRGRIIKRQIAILLPQ